MGWLGVALLLALAGCGDQCERLCREVSVRLDGCMGDVITWPDVGARSRADFVDQCRLDWDRTSSNLTSSDVGEAVDICRDGRRLLQEFGCDEIRALYLP